MRDEGNCLKQVVRDHASCSEEGGKHALTCSMALIMDTVWNTNTLFTTPVPGQRAGGAP